MLVTRAWDDNSVNPKSVTDETLQCLFVPHSFLANVVLNYCSFHPDFHDHSSQIQREMLGGLNAWLQTQGHQQSTILARLSKQAVRDHRNVRLGGAGASQSTSTTSAGPQSGFLQGVPGIVSVYSRPGGGQTDNYYGGVPPFSSQPYTSYPGGPSSDAPPLPQSHSPRPPPSPSSHHGHGRTYGSAPPTQPVYAAAPEQSSYLPPGLSYTEPGLPSPYTSGPPNTSGSHYPGSSYPEQSLYLGQQGTGNLGMPEPSNISPSYSSPQANFPGTSPSFSSPGGRRFPDPQYDYGSGSGSGSGYGHGTYQPEY